MSGLEIERKFLVHKKMDWKRLASSCSHIQQGYFAAVNTVRIRIRDDRGYLTIKGPSHDGGLSRYEFEKEITLEEARQLMLLCEPGVIGILFLSADIPSRWMNSMATTKVW